jgi:hypothetical protein
MRTLVSRWREKERESEYDGIVRQSLRGKSSAEEVEREREGRRAETC